MKRGFLTDDAPADPKVIGSPSKVAPPMNIFRAKHDNVPESPVRTLYGRKGNILILPLDVCVLQTVNGREEFRPSPEDTRLIAAPIQDERDGRVGIIAQYDWPPTDGKNANPVVTAQLAPAPTSKMLRMSGWSPLK